MHELRTKTCSCCQRAKPLDDFYRETKASQGRRHLCKSCDRLYKKEYRRDGNKHYCVICDRVRPEAGMVRQTRVCESVNRYGPYTRHWSRWACLDCVSGVIEVRDDMKRELQGTAATCKHGHPFSIDNTYYWTRADGRQFRQCKACRRAYDIKRDAKRREVAAERKRLKRKAEKARQMAEQAVA